MLKSPELAIFLTNKATDKKMTDFYPPRPPRAFAVQRIMAINIFIFILWSIPNEKIFLFMAENFLVSWGSITSGKVWTLLTSAFSHNMFFHLLVNMLVLKSFGRVMEMAMGSWRLIKFYLMAAVFSSLAHALVSYFILHQADLPALGASGPIAGLVLLFSLLFPKQKIYLLGFIPLPALWGAFVFMGLDIWGVISQAKGHGLPIGHGAHLGGALFGVITYFKNFRKKQ